MARLWLSSWLRTAAFAALLVAVAAPTRAQRECSEFRAAPGAPPLYYEVFMIFFERDSAAITPRSAAVLANVARVYAPLPQCRVTIAAHADRSGPAAYNLALSRRRAQAVAAWLRRHGVRAAFHLEPFGETRWLVETADGLPEPQNRRAEIGIGAPPRRPD